MTLTTRLSLFFLSALAIVLIGFSAGLYGLARFHLFRQLDERCTAALETLAAAVEVEQDGLKWEGAERVPSFGVPMAWAVFNEEGQRLAGANAASPLQASLRSSADTKDRYEEDLTWHDERWRVAWRAERAVKPPSVRGGQVPPPDAHRALFLMVALPIDPVHRTLRTLLSLLIVLSLVTWLCAALVGQRLCRRALAPLTTMTQSARGICAEDLDRRLPAVGTGDEIDDLGRAFNDLLGRLQEAFERQRRFTGEASHQLRTPLTALLGQVEVALRRDRTPEEYRRVLGLVRDKADQLRQIVAMLLFLARADADARAPDHQRLDLSAWLADHLHTWESHPRREDIHLDVQKARPLWASSHAALLGQVVDNLLDNACKYSTPGTAIDLRAWSEEGRACLEVSDHGCGISEAELPHVFEPFFRSAEARRRGISGVGLGLSIAARIVAALGGTIAVESQPGLGCRFVVRLAAADADIAPIPCFITRTS